jgi:hypothetical protein
VSHTPHHDRIDTTCVTNHTTIALATRRLLERRKRVKRHSLHVSGGAVVVSCVRVGARMALTSPCNLVTSPCNLVTSCLSCHALQPFLAKGLARDHVCDTYELLLLQHLALLHQGQHHLVRYKRHSCTKQKMLYPAMLPPPNRPAHTHTHMRPILSHFKAGAVLPRKQRAVKLQHSDRMKCNQAWTRKRGEEGEGGGD